MRPGRSSPSLADPGTGSDRFLHSGPVKSRSDLLVALGLLVLGQAEVAVSGVEGDPLLAHLYWAAVAVAALFRRTRPLLFAVVCVGGLVPIAWLELVPEWSVIFPVAAPLAVFGVGYFGRHPVRSALLSIGFALVAVAIIWLNQKSGEAEFEYLGFEWVRLISIYLGAAGAGILLRDRSEALAKAQAKLDALAPLESELGTVVAAARDEVSREIHAVVRSCLQRLRTAIDDARLYLEVAPGEARFAIARARGLSRQAMDEMRRMLGLLRDDSAAKNRTHMEEAEATEEPGLLIRLARVAASQALVLLLLASGVLFAFQLSAEPDALGGDLALGWRLAGAAVTAALFVFRRRLPLVTVVGVPVVLFLRTVVFEDRLPLDLFIWSAAFVAAAYLRPDWRAVAGGLFVLAMSTATAWAAEPETPWQAYAAFSATLIVVWMIGWACRERVAQRVELERLEEAEQERRRGLAARAVREQRREVARELHDRVGHGLTAITLQCAGAERQLPQDPDRASELVSTVRELTVETEAELSDLLSALSGEGEPPLPSLDAVPELAEQMRDQGIEIDLETSGELNAVPAGAGAAAYRIVQESLNNAGKYSAGPVTASVELRGDRIELLILNPESSEPGEGFKYGLVGIRERAEAYGGHLDAGPDGEGQWRVQAELPLSPATTSPPS